MMELELMNFIHQHQVLQIYIIRKEKINYQLNEVGGYWSNPTYGRYTPNTGYFTRTDGYLKEKIVEEA